jgi:outer membrane protein
MLRVYFLQQWFSLSDPAVEEALYDSPVMRRFAQIDLGNEPVPDETTVCKFRHLLEQHSLGSAILEAVNIHLQSRGIKITTGTIVDATIIHAPSSTKNREQKRDPEMPSFEIASQYSEYSDNHALKADLLGQSFRIPVTEQGLGSYQAMATVPIFTGGRISHAIAAASSAAQAAKSMETASDRDLKLQVAEAYVNVLRASSYLRVAKSHVETLEAHQKDVDNLVDQGMAARTAKLSVEVALLDAQQQVVQAENVVNLSKAAYNRLLGRPLDQEVTLDELSPEPEMQQEDVASLSSLAIANRTELQAIECQRTALDHQSKAVRGETLPQFGVSAGYQYIQDRYLSPQGSWLVAVGAQWTVFDGGSSHSRASALTSQVSAASEQKQEVSSQISLQVRQSWLDLTSTRKRVEVTEAAIVQANENLRVARDRYINGLATYTEVLDAETMRVASETSHSNALYDAVMAGLRLRYAVGQL